MFGQVYFERFLAFFALESLVRALFAARTMFGIALVEHHAVDTVVATPGLLRRRRATQTHEGFAARLRLTLHVQVRSDTDKERHTRRRDGLDHT